MGWIKRAPKEHNCATPNLQNTTAGGIWQCDPCGATWDVKRFGIWREWSKRKVRLVE